jgi:hypothetical protein
MGNITSQMPLQSALPLTAVVASGITTGVLTGVTFLDVRTFKALVAKKDADTIKKLFPIWWPHGKSFMVPSLAFNLLAHLGSYAVTSNKLWILTGCVIASIGPYTGIVMSEDIETLRGNKKEIGDEDVFNFTKSFCKLHYPRMFLALFSFGTSLCLLTNKI